MNIFKSSILAMFATSALMTGSYLALSEISNPLNTSQTNGPRLEGYHLSDVQNPGDSNVELTQGENSLNKVSEVS